MKHDGRADPQNGRERLEAQRHAPYQPALSRAEREEFRRSSTEVPDEQLAEEEAVRLAYAEQRREPADLIGRAA